MSVPLLYIGDTERALEVLETAARVDPLHGDWLRWQLGLAHWQAGDCAAGLEAMMPIDVVGLGVGPCVAVTVVGSLEC